MKFTTSICSLALLATLSPAALAGQSTDKDFQWYCESDEATPAQKRTVAELYKSANISQENVSCHDAFIMLNDQSSLQLYNTELADLAPISGFDKVTFLGLGSNNLTSIKTLPGSAHLGYLLVNYNKLTEFPDISRFPALTGLNLNYNPISELPAISSIRQLKRLALSGTKVSDLSELKDLPLEGLTIDNMENPSVLDTVPAMPSLRSLGVDGMKLVDLKVIERFPNLTDLSIGYNNLTNLNGIEQLKGITYLYLSGNKIESIPDGISFGEMSYLGLDGNPIKDFTFLSKIKKITIALTMDDTSFSDWGLIKHLLPSLWRLNLANTPLAEVSIPEGKTVTWTRLSELDLSGTKIRSLAFFKQVTAPELKSFKGPTIEAKTEENCPTSGVPAPVATFCKSAN